MRISELHCGFLQFLLMSLTLHVHRPWFDAIVHGYKTVEYRRATPHWVARIESKTYDKVVFQNGYGRHLPTAELEYLGYDRHVGADGMQYYRLRLGRVLRVANYSVRGGGGGRRTPARARGEHVDLNQCLDPSRPEDCMQFCQEAGAWVPRPLPPPRLELEVDPEVRRGAATPAPPCISPVCAPRGKPVGQVHIQLHPPPE